MQRDYLSHVWKIFIWDSWKIMVEWPKMHLLMQWMTSSQGSCINKSSFSPLVLMQILSIVSKPKLTRQVSCGLLKSVFYFLLLLFFHLEWTPTFGGGFFCSEENIYFQEVMKITFPLKPHIVLGFLVIWTKKISWISLAFEWVHSNVIYIFFPLFNVWL